MYNYKSPTLSCELIKKIKIGCFYDSSGLKVVRYLRTNSSGLFLDAIVYIEEWDDLGVGHQFRGAYYGYSGGGEYDGGFFTVEIENDASQVFNYVEVENSIYCNIFNALMYECSRFYIIDDDKIEISPYGNQLIKRGDVLNDGVVYMDADFDGDMLSEISQMWVISLRFIC